MNSTRRFVHAFLDAPEYYFTQRSIGGSRAINPQPAVKITDNARGRTRVNFAETIVPPFTSSEKSPIPKLANS
jgi:hypothetical protein